MNLSLDSGWVGTWDLHGPQLGLCMDLNLDTFPLGAKSWSDSSVPCCGQLQGKAAVRKVVFCQEFLRQGREGPKRAQEPKASPERPPGKVFGAMLALCWAKLRSKGIWKLYLVALYVNTCI